MAELTTIACSGCPASKKTNTTTNGLARVPRGWVRLPSGVYCDACRKAKFIIRAVAFPVAAPVGISWEDLRSILDSAWSESTSLANWAILALAKSDVLRTPDMAKLPAMPVVNLYKLFNQFFENRPRWSGATQAANLVMRQAEFRYRKDRYAVLWQRRQALATFRYPFPYPVDADGWAARVEDNSPVVEVSLPGGRVTLRLRGGDNFRRQLSAFHQIVSGEAVRRELAIYRKSFGGSSSQAVADKTPGGGQSRKFRVMVKMVAWLTLPFFHVKIQGFWVNPKPAPKPPDSSVRF